MKKMTPYQLAKLSKVNYLTARKFWERHNLDEWIKKIEENPMQELKNFKVSFTKLPPFFFKSSLKRVIIFIKKKEKK